MRKFLTALCLIFIGCNVLADGDLWDNFADTNSYGQKAVTDQDFEKALESKQKKKKRDKNIPKGENFFQSNETETLTNTSKEPDILLVPVALKVNGNGVLPIGHYEVEGVKENGYVYLKFYQAHSLFAKIPAEETEDDFGEETIKFVKLKPHGETHVEIIYGGVDFNAYAIIDIE